MPRRSRRDMARKRMRDMARRRDRARRRDYGMGYDGNYDYPEHSIRHSRSSVYPYDYAKDSIHSQSTRQHYGDYGYGMMDYGYYGSHGSRDYGEDEEYLSDDELMEWSRELLKDVEEKDKGYMTRENITQRAKDMGVKFKDFTEDELVVATLMEYTDYADTLGTNNLDIFIRMAKDFFDDPDSELQGSEKLATYYDEIICAD